MSVLPHAEAAPPEVGPPEVGPPEVRHAHTAHAWMPSSPCGRHCLPRRKTTSRVGVPVRALRLLRAAGAMLAALALGVALPLVSARTRSKLVRGWFRGLLRAVGAELLVHDGDDLANHGLASPVRSSGETSSRGLLVASNHVSWLDVVALESVRPMRMLAKVEVARWPVVGPLAGRVGTLYIDRDRLRSLPAAVAEIADALRAGSVVATFPEGTTSCGIEPGGYRPAVFQAAIDAGVPIRPVVVRYRSRDGHPTTSASFVGEQTLVESVLAVVAMRGLVVEVVVLPEIEPISDRRELARRVQHAAWLAGLGDSDGHDSDGHERHVPAARAPRPVPAVA